MHPHAHPSPDAPKPANHPHTRVCLVGSGDACGVADYTRMLAAALRPLGLQVTLHSQEDWRLGRLRPTMAALSATRSDVLHIQYPAAHYSRSLLPQIAAALTKARAVVITLHEYAHARRLRQAAGTLFALTRAWVVFTNLPDRAAAIRLTPWLSSRSSVIPIGSNLEPVTSQIAREEFDVAYFGLIRPGKGLEDFLDLANLSTATGRPYRFVVVGAVPPRHRRFAIKAKNLALPDAPIRWVIDAPPHDAARALATAKFAYLPFPDGVSERRGSILAALTAGLLTITKLGPQTPASLLPAICPAATPRAALAALDSLRADAEAAAAMRRGAEAYVAPRQWSAIALAHHNLYRRLLANGATAPPTKSGASHQASPQPPLANFELIQPENQQ